jgi:hypothetical protein
MSRVTVRGALAAMLVVSVFAAPAATADAKSKPKKCPKGQVLKKAKKGKKRCVKKPKPKPPLATPVSVELLPGSQATVDVPAVPLPGGYVIPGMPVTRVVPISGTLKGSIPGGYRLGQDNDINLSEAAITPGPVDILSDPACSGAPTLRLNPVSNVVLDKTAPSAGKVFQTGKVTANVRVLLRLAFDSRTEAGCDKPLVTMGTSESVLPVALEGMVERATGLTALTLDGPAVPLTISVCLTPGAADQPCATPPVGYPVRLAVHAIVKIAVG